MFSLLETQLAELGRPDSARIRIKSAFGHPYGRWAALGMYAAAHSSAVTWCGASELSEAICMALKAANDESVQPPLNPNLKPEEQELARKREEQTALETELAERE